MSKFIAMLCAAAMLVSSTSVVLADDMVESDGSDYSEGYEDIYYDEGYVDNYFGEDYFEDTYYDDGYLDGEYFGDEYNISDGYLEPGTFEETYTSEYPEDIYIDNSVTSSTIQVIDISQNKDKEETKAETGGVFTDVPADAYYADAVKFCYERGLFNGMTDTEFAPDVTMTRGMFATVFGRIQNADLNNVTLTFTDVKADAYYASYIAWATNEGIMDGYSDTTFGPDDSITREQAAKMLHAYLANVKNINITDVAANYADIATVSDWAAKAINANTSVGYLRADENNNLNPKAELTRADACYAVATTLKLVEALEAEGLKDAEKETVTEVKDPASEITPLESSSSTVDTQAQMSEIPEADKDQVTEDFQPYPGTEYNPIDD